MNKPIKKEPIMCLLSFFEDLKNNEKKVTEGESGLTFEDEIQRMLIENGLKYKNHNDSSKMKNELQKMKAQIVERNTEGFLDNITSFKEGEFVSQPYGTQSFPDYIVFTNNKIITLEAKFSKNNSKVPFWNGHLPKQKTIYIFGQHKNKRLTFFLGREILTKDEQKELIDLNHKIFNLFKKEGYHSNSGFQLYYRQTFQQKSGSYDYFKKKNLKSNERNVFSFLKKQK